MPRTFFTTAALMTVAALTLSAKTARHALAADGEPEPPVTPFIDSGNDLPDLDARAREARGQEARIRDAWPRRWYGWQIVAADLATTACIAGLNSGVCLAPYFGAGIGIHLGHNRPGAAGISFALRTGMPALGAAAGILLANCSDRQRMLEDCGFGPTIIGTLVGMAVGAAIDAALGFERVPPSF